MSEDTKNSQPTSNLVLVKEGAGLLGSHRVRRLLRDGYRVRVLDDYATGKRENLEKVRDFIEMIGGVQLTLNQLDATRRSMLSVSPRVHYAERTAGDLQHSLADISRSQLLLNYTPQVPFYEGLVENSAYFRSTRY